MKDKIARESINELRDDFEEQRIRVRETFRKVGEWMTTLNDMIVELTPAEKVVKRKKK